MLLQLLSAAVEGFGAYFAGLKVFPDVVEVDEPVLPLVDCNVGSCSGVVMVIYPNQCTPTNGFLRLDPRTILPSAIFWVLLDSEGELYPSPERSGSPSLPLPAISLMVSCKGSSPLFSRESVYICACA